MLALVWLHHRSGPLRLLLVPAAWVVFDYLRSVGFLGYPWGMLGATQYRFVPFIQVAALTGVWGVTFLVILGNAALVCLVLELRSRLSSGGGRRVRDGAYALTLGVCAAVLVPNLIVGHLVASSPEPTGDRVRVALIQHSIDPRVGDHRRTLDMLKELTLRSLSEDPDLIVWPETAFVPNIRRWSQADPARHPYARMVRELLSLQKQTATWLVTGNDDYELRSLDGEPVRFGYNAAVFLSPTGERAATYRKMHLIPFIEFFPYQEQLPRLHRLLLDHDVFLWEPGSERTLFHHPRFSFATPICFEDTFPRDVRAFVRAGAQAIINISNDFWSLSDVEAQQHFANALFRAVENRVPLLRAGTSGRTGYVDTTGRLVSALPYHAAAWQVVTVTPSRGGRSVYTRLGDWFPIAMAVAIALLAVAPKGFIARGYRRRDRSCRESAECPSR